MIEGIVILAVGAMILIYAEMKSNDDIVEEQTKDKFKKAVWI
jgi:hypothetical protein